MSDNKNENVVIAFYATAEAAEAAVETLKSWDKASDDVKLGAIGTMVVTPEGGVGADCVEDGGHQVGVGMGWGLGGLAQSCQRSLDGGVVPFGLELRQPRVLSPVGFRVGARPDVYSAGSPR